MPSLSPKTRRYLKLAAIALILVVLAVAMNQLPVADTLRSFNQRVADWGLTGVIVFILVYALATVLLIPGSALTLGAGFAFGLVTGMIAVSIASTLGAALAFLVGRHLARDKVRATLADRKKFEAVDRAVSKRGWKIVALLRLSPVFPFVALNYLLGLTGIRFSHYVAASWAGMLPGTLLYVYLGYLGKAGIQTAAGESEPNLLRWIYLGAGLLATLAVTVYVTRLARRAIRDATPLEETA